MRDTKKKNFYSPKVFYREQFDVQDVSKNMALVEGQVEY